MYLTAPRGVVPRSQDCNLGPQYAAKAENIKLKHGRWEPWRTPKEIVRAPKDARNAHVRDCCWVSDADCLSSFIDAGACEQTYLSRPNRRPEVSRSVCEHDFRYLGFPVPDVPAAMGSSDCPKSCGADTTLRSYVITYSSDCEEGPPSCPTAPIPVDKKGQVVIGLPSMPDVKWGITHVNVYRTAGTWDSEQGLVDFNPNALTSGWTPTVVDQHFFLVCTIPADEYHVGCVDDGTSLGRLLTTEDFHAPPEDLQIGGETAAGSLVGWTGHEVWFSERNAYHAWPVKGAMSFPYQVNAVCVCQDTVYVLTEANAYVIQDSADCQDSTCRPVQAVKDAYPLCSRRACIATPIGALYSSLDGLVLLSPDTESRIVSSLAFARDDWRSLDPSRIQLKTARDYLFLLTDQVFLVWDFALDDSGQLPEDLTTLDFLPDSLIIDDQEQLFFLLDSTVYEFDAGDRYMTMTWRQANQDYGTQGIITAMRAKYLNRKVSTPNTVTVFQDCEAKLRRPLGDRPARLRTRLGSDYQLQISGTEPQCGLYYGIGLADLTAANNG